MKVLALITARKGSERIPGKNTKSLGGKPLIQWTIDAAKEATTLKDILISTDDSNILEMGESNEVLAPWIRPDELSGDEASSVDVCLHALDWYESEYGEVDAIMLLQPTSPFRTSESIEKAIGIFKSNPEYPVIGFQESPVHPYWCFENEDGKMKPLFGMDKFTLRSQDLPSSYTVNGALYLISPKLLRQNRSFYQGSINPIIMDEKESLDIDDMSDWEKAESLL